MTRSEEFVTRTEFEAFQQAVLRGLRGSATADIGESAYRRLQPGVEVNSAKAAPLPPRTDNQQKQPGWFKIRVERDRQMEAKGYGSEHDDKQIQGELPAYALQRMVACWDEMPQRIKNLVEAGALIAAEIDRLVRCEKEKCRRE